MPAGRARQLAQAHCSVMVEGEHHPIWTHAWSVEPQGKVFLEAEELAALGYICAADLVQVLDKLPMGLGVAQLLQGREGDACRRLGGSERRAVKVEREPHPSHRHVTIVAHERRVIRMPTTTSTVWCEGTHDLGGGSCRPQGTEAERQSSPSSATPSWVKPSER